MQTVVAIIIYLAMLMAPAAQSAPPAACVDASAYADAPTALAAAQSGTRCLYLPAGVYPVTQAGGDWLNITAANVEIKGDGIGRTIIQTTGITLTNNLYVITARAPFAHIHDLTISIGTGYSTTKEVSGVLLSVGALHSTVERVEVVGGYTGSGGNGFGIGTYQPYDQGQGAQYATIQNNYVHDSPATAIGVNSSNNLLLNNHIARVGTTSLQHGFYAQGGNNLYQGNIVENVSGYSFHGHKQVPSLDGSGDRYIGNISLNPGTAHIVINSTVNGSNPLVPSGAALTRYATISGNTFRNTAGKRNTNAIWCNGVPCVIDGNALEDTFTTTGSGWIEDNAGSVITNNILTTSGVAPDGATNYAMIRVSGTAGATVANNRLTNSQYGRGIVASGARHSITNNTVFQAGATQADALLLSGDMLMVTGNRLESTGGGYTLAFGSPLTNLTLTGNYFKRSGDLFNATLTGITGRITDNVYDGTPRWNGSGAGVLR